MAEGLDGKDCVRWLVWGKECWFDGDGLRMVRALEACLDSALGEGMGFSRGRLGYSEKRRLLGGDKDCEGMYSVYCH